MVGEIAGLAELGLPRRDGLPERLAIPEEANASAVGELVSVMDARVVVRG